MATVLFLDGIQVYPSSGQNIKLTRENPYFTQSDSYTLDVTIPLDILENMRFFGNINRVEKKKIVKKFQCKLIVNNRILLDGSAKMVQITEKEVKVQLLGGNSEINFLSEDSKVYIDEMDLGFAGVDLTESAGWGTANSQIFVIDWSKVIWTCTRGYVRFVPKEVYDETLGWSHIAFHYNLIDMLRTIFKNLGYELGASFLDQDPWDKLYVATANYTNHPSHTLPHWTPKNLLDELKKLFNITFVFDQLNKKVTAVANSTFFSELPVNSIEVTDEFSVEMSEENSSQSVSSDNLSYDMSDSSHHDYDVIDDNVRNNAPKKEFQTSTQARSAYNAATEDEKKKNIYCSPTSKMTGWINEYKDGEAIKERLELTQIDVFSPLVREEKGNRMALKICPVAIGKWVEEEEIYGRKYIVEYRVPSLSCPTGSDNVVKHGLENTSGGGTEQYTIQEYIQGEESIEKQEKEDRMQIMFIPNTPKSVPWKISYTKAMAYPAFTDYLLKKDDNAEQPPMWSLSLNPSDAKYYIGQLHNNGFSFNMKAKYCVKFAYKGIPDAKRIFVIRNKKYGCEKIEVNITDEGVAEIKTAYLYELS